MKKFLILLLTLVCLVSATSCGKRAKETDIPSMNELQNTRDVDAIQHMKVEDMNMPDERVYSVKDISLILAIIFIAVLVVVFSIKDYFDKKNDPVRKWTKL